MEKKSKAKKKGFNALDLISIVVFAVLFRVLWIVLKMVGLVYPFNFCLLHLAVAFALSACIVVVKKSRASFYFTLAWLAINFFLQGEVAYWWLSAFIIPPLPELYFYLRGKAGNKSGKFEQPNDVYFSMPDIIIGANIYVAAYQLFNWYTGIHWAMVKVPYSLIYIVAGISVVTVSIGAFMGYKVGYKIKGLIV